MRRMAAPPAAAESPRARLAEVARVFGRLGATAFGGPAAHLALMEDELVRRRGWLSRERFLDLLGATNLIPGPNSTEMAIHLGYLRAGWPGLAVAGAAFIVPAALVVSALAWLYVRLGAVPDAAAVLAGVKPVVLVVVAQALWRFLRTAVKGVFQGALAAAALAAAALGADELAVLVAAGAIAALRAGVARRAAAGLAPVLPLAALAPAAAAAAAPVTPGGILAVFLKIGSILYGSGYVLLAFLRADLVIRLGWLTDAQLLDAVAVGQVTPGPVFTTATFVGYVLAGPAGAALATVGIFLPSFVFVALSGPLVPRIRASPLAGAFLDGVTVASLGLMALVAAQLGRDALARPAAWAIAAVAALLLLAARVNSAWLVIGGAAAGWAVYVLG
jgi:chromate transporter